MSGPGIVLIRRYANGMPGLGVQSRTGLYAKLDRIVYETLRFGLIPGSWAACSKILPIGQLWHVQAEILVYLHT